MTTRVCIVQPIIPRYRVPIFESLSEQSGLDVEIWADLSDKTGSLTGITKSSNLKLRNSPLKEYHGIVWQPAVVEAVNSDFDVVILNWNVRAPFMHAALCKFQRSPIVLWGHGFGTHHAVVGDFLRMLDARIADACLFYGPTGRNRFIEKGIAKEKLFIAPNALDQIEIQKARNLWLSPNKREPILKKQQIVDDPIILYLSRLEPEKNPELAIDALVLILKDIPSAKLVYIGDGSIRSELESKVILLGISNSVRFLGAMNNENDIAPWALAASLLIHPGALGLSIFHAFGYGLPVITTNRTSLQMPEFEALHNGINGMVYKHGNIMDLAQICKSILLDKIFKNRLSEGALKTVLEKDGRNKNAMIEGMLKAINYAARKK